MNRWSVSRLFRKVTSQDFLDAVTRMQESMAKTCNGPIALEIKFYNGLKHSITSYQPDLIEWLDEQNSKLVFEQITSLAKFNENTWLKAAFVEATLRPQSPEKAPPYAFAQLEAKGTKPRQICFYAQPEQVGEPARSASLERFGKWRVGDGYGANHTVSYG